MVRCTVRDLLTVQKREITPNGYLVAPAIIGRCGIQPYTRAELGLDGDQTAVVRLMRTPEEVFRPETIASFENVPITDDHPPAGVDADNWRDVSRGHVRDVGRKEGDLLGGTTFVMDGGTVARVAGGKTALSCGYSFDLDLTPGVATDGQSFDGYQRNILGDHLSIVDSPRGGPVCRIGDKNEETIMAKRTLFVDGGYPLGEFEDTQAATVETYVKKIQADRDKVLTDLANHRKAAKKAFDAKDTIIADKEKVIADKDKVIADKDKVIEAKDAEIAALKADLAKAKAIDVEALVTERAQVIADAKTLAPDLVVKGSSNQIRRAAIVAAIAANDTNKVIADGMFGDAGVEKATDDQLKAAMKMMLGISHDAIRTAQDRAVAGALAGTGGSNTVDGKVEVVDISKRDDVFLGQEGLR